MSIMLLYILKQLYNHLYFSQKYLDGYMASRMSGVLVAISKKGPQYCIGQVFAGNARNTCHLDTYVTTTCHVINFNASVATPRDLML
jgi:hypothetical protein